MASNMACFNSIYERRYRVMDTSKIAEMLVAVGIPSFITLFLFYLKESTDSRRMQVNAKLQQERAFTLLEKDMVDMKKTLDDNTRVLESIEKELTLVRERLVRLESTQ